MVNVQIEQLAIELFGTICRNVQTRGNLSGRGEVRGDPDFRAHTQL